MSKPSVAAYRFFKISSINFLCELFFVDKNTFWEQKHLKTQKDEKSISLEAFACKTNFFELSTYSFNYLQIKKTHLKNHISYHPFWVIFLDLSFRLNFAHADEVSQLLNFKIFWKDTFLQWRPKWESIFGIWSTRTLIHLRNYTYF